MIETGRGLLTIMFRIAQEFWTGGLSLDNNYMTSLTSTATGRGLLFALIASYLTKGKGESIYFRVARFLMRKKRLDVRIHRKLMRMRPHRQLDMLILLMLYYPIYGLVVKYRL
jgi:hypothetical protein